MLYQLPNQDSTAIQTWSTNSESWSSKKYSQRPQQPSSLISNLSSLFTMTVASYNLTKQEALDAIGYFLYEYDDEVHLQLFKCFVDNRFLYKPSEEDKHYVVSHSYVNRDVSGVFMSITKCYSPLCQPKQITCYSPLCPNKRLSHYLRVTNNQQSKGEEPVIKEQESKYWIESIPHYIRDSTTRKELKRQAGIAELVLTEQNYCQDLDILHRIYAVPLLESNEIISNPSRRQRFYNNVFSNYLDITHLHHSFYNQLTSHNRQTSYFIGRVGTIIMQHVINLIEPYIQYASYHVKAVYCMTTEYKSNPQFAKFLSAQDALKCTRRLGLRHYLTSPTLWIGKFKLMVEAILKNTEDDADQLSLKASLAILHDTLCRMNSCAKLSPEDLRFEELSTSIYTMMNTELQLLPIPENSQLLGEEEVWLARSTHPLQPTFCHIFLFSHALLLTHPRITSTRTEYVLIRHIPIQLLTLNNSNATTSMIRRLSFASTSMVSTPMHLLSNLRRQKSTTSDLSSSGRSTSTDNSSNEGNARATTTTTTNKLGRSNTTIHVAPCAIQPAKRSITINTHEQKNYRLLSQFQIKKRLSMLKNRWNMSSKMTASPPHSGVAGGGISRRDSAPALLAVNQEQQQQQTTEINSIQQRRRTLNISHMAYPEDIFKLEFHSRSDRLIWETLIKDVTQDSVKSNDVFKTNLISQNLVLPSVSKSAGVNNGTVGKIRCAYNFVYTDGNVRKSMIALGTQNGVWWKPRDEQRPFQLVLPNQDVHQLSVLGDKLIVMRQEDKHHLLIAYSLNSIMKECDLDWCVVKTSSVLCFTVGKIRNQPVIVYLTKRLQSTWLVIIVPNENTTKSHHWFKKYKTEYKVTIKDATNIQIIRDTVFVQSDRYGIERIDITTDHQKDANWTFMGTNVGLLSTRSNGLVCTLHHAYSVALFDRHLHQCENNSKALIRTKFESQVCSVALIHPYLIAFSPSVIEIRDIETTKLLQAIRGSQIQFLSNMNDLSQPLYFSMLSDDKMSTSIYQLQLSLSRKQ